MKENMDQFEQMLQKEFDKVAREEEDSLREDDSLVVPEGKMDKLREKINGKIREIEGMDLYACLSEEDQKALELGRRIMEQEVQKEFQAKTVRKKRRIQAYIGLAAALVAALAIGVTSMGGAERVIKMVTQMVGGREVEKINSSEDNYIMEKESEEEAYQRLKEDLGIEPVRIIYKTEKMKFKKIKIDDEIQTAELFYEYDDKAMLYLINASYLDTSMGIDVDDKIVETFNENINGCDIEIKEYEIAKLNTNKYSATFKYKGLEYCIIVETKKEEFYNILNNLFFP